MRVLLDANVLLDSMLRREPWLVESDAILAAHVDGRVKCCIAVTTACNLYYVCRRLVGNHVALDQLKTCLTTFDILPVTKQILLNALSRTDRDFEDNILQSIAVEARLDAIVTRDPGDFRKSVIPAISPPEMIARLPPT